MLLEEAIWLKKNMEKVHNVETNERNNSIQFFHVISIGCCAINHLSSH